MIYHILATVIKAIFIIFDILICLLINVSLLFTAIDGEVKGPFGRYTHKGLGLWIFRGLISILFLIELGVIWSHFKSNN